MDRSIFRHAVWAQLLALAIFFVALLLFSAAPAAAQSTIKILVNDEPITSYDIQQRTRMIRVFTRGRLGEKDAIDQLIEERLMLQEAARRNVTVTDAEIDQEVATRASAANLKPAQFAQAMRQAGFDPKTFRSFVRANLAWGRIVRARFRATVNVTDQDIAAALSTRAPVVDEKTAFEYMLQQIVFVVPNGAGAAVETQRKNEANAFRSAFAGCEQSLQQAAAFPGVVIKPQVRREEGQIAEPLKTTLAPLAVGATTEPERVPEGIQFVAICAKKEIAGETETTAEVRAELTSERGQLLARRYLRDLRSDAVIEYR